jgi:F0F1-type ATP synthase delta subunit
MLVQANLLDKVEGELLAVNELINKSPNFSAFLSNPTISRQDKANKVRS